MPARVLFVCTANRCRSPFAEAIARRAGADLPIEFNSRGLLIGGEPVPDTGRRIAAGLGLDLDGHRSIRLDPAELTHYDLVLTMTREQSRELVATDPELWPRVFTVPEFARWTGEHGAPSGRLRPWLESEAAGREISGLFRWDPDDEVADPLGAPPRVWRRMAARLEDQIGTILEAFRRFPTRLTPSTE